MPQALRQPPAVLPGPSASRSSLLQVACKRGCPIPHSSKLRSEGLGLLDTKRCKHRGTHTVLERRSITRMRRGRSLSKVGKSVLKLRGRQWRALSKVDREATVELCFRYWRRRGFPYYSLSDDDIVEDYRQLELVDSRRILIGGEIQMSMVGVRLANFFHPQLWEVPVRRAHTPLERFHDDAKLRNLIRKALTIWPD